MRLVFLDFPTACPVSLMSVLEEPASHQGSARARHRNTDTDTHADRQTDTQRQRLRHRQRQIQRPNHVRCFWQAKCADGGRQRIHSQDVPGVYAHRGGRVLAAGCNGWARSSMISGGYPHRLSQTPLQQGLRHPSISPPHPRIPPTHTAVIKYITSHTLSPQ